jgi:hypothetical protein
MNSEDYNWVLEEDLGEVFNKIYNRTDKRAIFRIENNFTSTPSRSVYVKVIDNSFESAMMYLLKDAKKEDIFSAFIDNEYLKYPIYIPPDRIRSFNKHQFLDNVLETGQYFPDFLKSGKIEISVKIYK